MNSPRVSSTRSPIGQTSDSDIGETCARYIPGMNQPPLFGPFVLFRASALLVAAAVVAGAQGLQIPQPTGYVNDFAHVIPASNAATDYAHHRRRSRQVRRRDRRRDASGSRRASDRRGEPSDRSRMESGRTPSPAIRRATPVSSFSSCRKRRARMVVATCASKQGMARKASSPTRRPVNFEKRRSRFSNAETMAAASRR